jgi:poly(3-hydroxybutyrate) depolymerase
MGCSITCDCCGNQCHSVKFVSAAEDLWADTDATESPRGEAPRKLLVFFHSYRGDSTHALSKYYLDQLVQEHNYLVVALEGRYVRRVPARGPDLPLTTQAHYLRWTPTAPHRL